MNLHVSGTAAYRIDDIDHYETPDKEFYRFDLESAQNITPQFPAIFEIDYIRVYQ